MTCRTLIGFFSLSLSVPGTPGLVVLVLRSDFQPRWPVGCVACPPERGVAITLSPRALANDYQLCTQILEVSCKHSKVRHLADRQNNELREPDSGNPYRSSIFQEPKVEA